jgi:hypothetical protein
VTIRDDGFVEQAEMTSCGLNGGPLPALRETPAHCCCHLRGAEGILHYSSSVTWNDAHPFVAQEADAGAATSAYAYVYNLRDKAEAGYKYLAFAGTERSVQLGLRGDFHGEVSVRLDAPDGREVASVAVACGETWRWAQGALAACVDGTHAVYLVPQGEGSLDLRAFAFENA